MKKALLVMSLVCVIVISISAQSPAERRLSVEGGFTGYQLKNSQETFFKKNGFSVSVTEQTRNTLDSKIVGWINWEMILHKIQRTEDGVPLFVFDAELCGGTGYLLLDEYPCRIFLGAGLSDHFYFVGSSSFISMGIGAIADVHYNITEKVFLDANIEYDYRWKMDDVFVFNKNVTDNGYSARVGVGFKLK